MVARCGCDARTNVPVAEPAYRLFIADIRNKNVRADNPARRPRHRRSQLELNPSARSNSPALAERLVIKNVLCYSSLLTGICVWAAASAARSGSCENLVRTYAALVVDDDCRYRRRPRCRIGERLGDGRFELEDSPSSIFSPVSTPAHEINTVAFFVVAITAVIFLIVAGLLTYSIVRFRARPGDDSREPPQVYGSNPIEFAWTTVPVIIVLVLILITARAHIYGAGADAAAGALSVHVIAHQWWCGNSATPTLGVVTRPTSFTFR